MSISNDQIYDALLGIKSDIGGLQASSELQLTAIQNHAGRIAAVETTLAKQAGAARVWALVATGAGALAGAVGSFFGFHR